MWWLFMNRTTGSTIFNTLYWLFPVLLTGLVFFDESKTAIYGIIITKKKRCVYLCSKALSVFFISFVSTLFLFLLNLFLVYVTCPSSMELSETMIPHTGTFSALLFQKSPFYEAVTYVILHAFALSLLTVLYLAMEMSRNVQSGNTQNLKSTVIQRSFPKWSVAERRKTAAASDQAAVCACAHSRYFAGGSPSGLRV